VLHWKLNAELAFMNVCQSGRFRLEGRAEIQGFLRGFALAGVRSVVAPATHVDPKAAGDLALAFYREWSGNTTKAEALQRAQQRLRRTHPDPRHWAAHSLVGDYL
jgi:CHAT domain-containing protein